MFEQCPNLVGHRRADNITSNRALWDSPFFLPQLPEGGGGPVAFTHALHYRWAPGWASAIPGTPRVASTLF